MRIKEVITNLRSCRLLTNSPGQPFRKCVEDSLESMNTDFRVSLVQFSCA